MLEILAAVIALTSAALCLLALAVGMGAVDPVRLPGWLMKILHELTNHPRLEKLLAAQPDRSEAVAIDKVALAERLTNEIYGQDEAIHNLVAQIDRRFARVHRTLPIGVFLFAGPPGVGKTALGHSIADALYGRDSAYLVNMARMKDAASLTMLFGATAGYTGSDRKAGLMAHLQTTPRTVVILDEFEKADPVAQNAFLDVWNDGVVREATQSHPIRTSDAIFVLTVNAKQDEIAKVASRTDLTAEEISKRCDDILKDVLPGPVLSRIDQFVAFRPLSRMALAAVTLRMIRDEVEAYDLKLQPVPADILIPYVTQFDRPDFDARQLRRIIEKDFGTHVAQLKSSSKGISAISISFDAKSSEMTITPVKGAKAA